MERGASQGWGSWFQALEINIAQDDDFTGGTLVEVRMPQAVSVGTIRTRLAAVGLGHSIIQEFGDGGECGRSGDRQRELSIE